jgi:hypothetical protein
MKKLIVIFLIIPFISKAQFTITNTSTTSLVEIRTGTWPLNLNRIIKESDTCYVLEFRDQGYANEVVMTTLRFANMDQLKYFQKGLSALRTGNTGDIAKYKEYSLKRVDVKREGITYILNCGAGSTTNFQQPDADKFIAAVQKL